MHLGSWVSARRRLLLELSVVFTVALLPRLVGVGTFLTADESTWVGRGVEFVRAVREFRFNDTLQTTHPGIPTLWISGVSSAIVSHARGQEFTFENIRVYMTASQVPLAVLNSLLVAGIFGAARTLFPALLALLAALVIALDPFLIGHSKLVHVDSLLAGFTVLSLLLFLRVEELSRNAPQPHRGATHLWALTGSAITGALAILTKLPGVILIPFALLILFSRGGSWKTAAARTERLRLFGQWLTIMVATILVLWPGLLWVPDPVGNVKTVQRDLLVAISTPHDMTEDYTLKPWHYPATLLTRTTIPTLAGFVLFLLFLGQSTWTLRRAESRPEAGRRSFQLSDLRTLWILLAFVVLFIVGMTLGAKKGDRYILSVFPVLDLLAVMGIAALVAKLRPRWPVPSMAAFTGLLLIIPLAITVTRLHPYQLAHFNRLFPANFSQELGWGEGLDQVAEFFNAMGMRDKTAVASWYPDSLRAFVHRPVQHLNSHTQLPIGYVVLYRNMFGRSQGHPANNFLDEYYKKQPPVFTANVNGLPYAWVYKKPVFQEVVGELTPEKTLVSELPVARGHLLQGVELLLATYRGRASEGELVIRVRESVHSPDLREARYPIRGTEDNQWIGIRFDRPIEMTTDGSLIVLITAVGTKDNNAPTVHFAANEEGAPRYALTTKRPLPKDILTATLERGLLGLRALENSP